MSNDWVKDISEMHVKFGVNDWVAKTNGSNDIDKLRKFLDFRMKFLDEELNETKNAVENGDPEEIVDGLIDLCVVAIGTLNAFDIDPYEAWNQVHSANMNKEPGVKPERPNPLGLPDLIKPSDWKGPSHNGNHGILSDLYKND